MDLNIILWIVGMLFSLGIFAVKVGFGLGFSGMKWKGVLLTLSLYLMLFVAIAVLSGHLIKLLEPVLKKGPYLHALMAAGMIAWGIYLVRQSSRATERQIKIQAEGLRLKEKSEIGNLKSKNSLLVTHHSLLLLIPCPVCLSAMTFSTWAALSVIKLPSLIVGIGLGVIFALLTLTIVGLTRIKQTSSPEVSLGLGMIAIGLYFMASLYLPAKIEEARGMYQSFLTEGSNIALNNSIGVFALLFVALVIGYLTNKKREVKK
ncbi:transporter [hot springs metagenome]|uniref:Transporter n=1 Tax=hot springs metagenome TaxID=433727 RepID=A0A5J4L0Y0_9ZZZZ